MIGKLGVTEASIEVKVNSELGITKVSTETKVGKVKIESIPKTSIEVKGLLKNKKWIYLATLAVLPPLLPLKLY